MFLPASRRHDGGKSTCRRILAASEHLFFFRDLGRSIDFADAARYGFPTTLSFDAVTPALKIEEPASTLSISIVVLRAAI